MRRPTAVVSAGPQRLCRARQGPILKVNGLAAVRISTAGESFEISGLAEDDARTLRDRVAELARLAKEDV